MKLICILWLFCLFLINSIDGRSVGNEFGFTKLEVDIATWATFQRRHTTATIPATVTAWNDLLHHAIADYGTKPINTFIAYRNITDLQRNFPVGRPQYVGRRPRRGNEYWSSTQQHIFVMILHNPRVHDAYYVCDCHQRFYVAAVDGNRRPVHYVGHAVRVGAEVDLTDVAGCTLFRNPNVACPGRREENAKEISAKMGLVVG